MLQILYYWKALTGPSSANMAPHQKVFFSFSLFYWTLRFSYLGTSTFLKLVTNIFSLIWPLSYTCLILEADHQGPTIKHQCPAIKNPHLLPWLTWLSQTYQVIQTHSNVDNSPFPLNIIPENFFVVVSSYSATCLFALFNKRSLYVGNWCLGMA